MTENSLILIPLLPFIGFLINGLLGSRLTPKAVALFGCLAPIGAFIVTVMNYNALVDGIAVNGPEASLIQNAFTWIQVTSHDGSVFSVPFKFRFDTLSAMMCLVVTGIGSLIHIYSNGYMKGDPGFARFFAYLNLFTAFMLLLVLGDNLLLLFIGWEGVGLCSYLLIGFWYKEHENAQAGKKAFIVNRIGDFGVLLAIFLLIMAFGTLDMTTISQRVEAQGFIGALDEMAIFGMSGSTYLTLVTLLLFLGCTGKSAQIPLYVWLPDAMAGPTPVSALIHAATMVTSGVYLCCRLHPLFAAAPDTMYWIMMIGAVTSLLAALIALTQNDIKKVLAYSTVSQLGYMFFAVGIGAFSAAFFHVVTHAFFKALLFLGSGSVIIAMHHEQDMRKMGGLKRLLPRTHFLFLIGTMALCGFPLLSGFVSKDEILYLGFHADRTFWVVTLLTAGLTAFYMIRCMCMTFWGESRVDDKVIGHVKEPGGSMEFPLWILAILSVFGGALNWPHFLGGHLWMTAFTGLPSGVPEGTHPPHELALAVVSVVVAALGFIAAYRLFSGDRAFVHKFAQEGAGQTLTSASQNKFWVDEIYDFVFVRPLEALAWALFWLVDRFVIDFLMVRGVAWSTRILGEGARRIQSGFVPAYVATFGLGVALLLGLILFMLRNQG